MQHSVTSMNKNNNQHIIIQFTRLYIKTKLSQHIDRQDAYKWSPPGCHDILSILRRDNRTQHSAVIIALVQTGSKKLEIVKKKQQDRCNNTWKSAR